MKNIIVTGSLAYDYVFDVDDYFSKYIQPDKIHQINISVISDTHKKTCGGTAGNIAFYLSKLGLSPDIFATAGHDFSEYKILLNDCGVKTRFIKIIKSISTPAGFAMTDKADNQIWMYSIGAMKFARNYHLTEIKNKIVQPVVVISPNDKFAMINYVNECANLQMDFIFDPAFYIPHIPRNILLKGVSNAKIIFGNDYEIAFIEKRLNKKIEKVVDKKQIVVKTLGEKGSEILSDNKWLKIGIYKTKAIDPTGAGDAYRAGFIYGYLNDLPIQTCGSMGAVVASFAVEVKGTMNLKFNKKAFEKRMKKIHNGL